MQTNKLKQLTRESRVVLGGSLQLPSTHLVEILGYAGFDFMCLDAEHGPYEMEAEMTNLIRACQVVGITPLVRIRENEPSCIMKVLDSGAQGIIVPRVCTGEDVERAIAACKYPPLGERGSCANVRAACYSSMGGQKYYPLANQETMVVPLIEEAAAVERIDEVLAPEGIDMIWLGPGDLSSSMGYPGQTKHPAVMAALERVTEAAKKRDIPVAALATLDDPAQMQYWVDQGVHIFLLSVTKTIFLAMQELVERTAKMGSRR